MQQMTYVWTFLSLLLEFWGLKGKKKTWGILWIQKKYFRRHFDAHSETQIVSTLTEQVGWGVDVALRH